MSTKKKIEHLWLYYKWVLGLVALFAVLISIVVTGYKNANTEILVAGEVVNLGFDAEGHEHITDGFFEKMNGVEGKQAVNLFYSNLVTEDTTNAYETYYVPLLRTVGEMESKRLDYMMVDSGSLPYYLREDLFLNLEELFTAEELAQMEENLIYMLYEETGLRVPVAINITDTELISQHLNAEAKAYIAFIANTPRKENCRLFYDHIVDFASSAQ